MRSLTVLCAAFTILHIPASSQITGFPFTEAFDSLRPPDLPAGWLSSSNRNPGVPDFTTVSSSSLSPPNALLSTNATIGQSITTPSFDFRGFTPDSLLFSVRRSASHTAPLVVEYSPDGGTTYLPVSPDSIMADGSTSYTRFSFPLPGALATTAAAMLRWRIIAAGTGTAGTLRLDDIRVTARSMFDLGIRGFSHRVTEGQHAIRTTIHNEGTGLITGFDLNLFLDENQDSVPEQAEFLDSFSYSGSISPADSVEPLVPIRPIPAGTHQVIGILSAEGDSNPDNNTLAAPVFVAYASSSIIINEVMYEPLSGGSEYVELHNPGSVAVDPSGWILSDRPGADGEGNEVMIPPSAGFIPPGGYLLFGADSLLRVQFGSIPGSTLIAPAGPLTLNNDGDCVILKDPIRTVIDSVAYMPEWHHPAVLDETGRSLERISPFVPGSDFRNWSTCTSFDGGSPGSLNSIAHTAPIEQPSLGFAPNPFSPDGDGYDDFVIIQFAPPPGSYSFSLRVFDTDGRLIRRLATNEPAGRSGSVVWDGMDDFRQKARIGMYVVLLEIHGSQGEILEGKKGVVVLAARL